MEVAGKVVIEEMLLGSNDPEGNKVEEMGAPMIEDIKSCSGIIIYDVTALSINNRKSLCVVNEQRQKAE